MKRTHLFSLVFVGLAVAAASCVPPRRPSRPPRPPRPHALLFFSVPVLQQPDDGVQFHRIMDVRG